jgi:signal peptidase
MALGVGLFQVALFVIAGLLFGFGYSPFARELLPMLGNLVYVTAMLLAVEITRAFLTAFLARTNRYLALILPAAIFTLIAIPVSRFTITGDLRSWITLSGEAILPALGENLLATYLVMLGGPAAALLYRGVLFAFEWLSPVLPNLDPMVAAFVGTVAPILSLVVLSGQLSGTDDRDSVRATPRATNSAGSIIVGIIAVTIIWFNTGLFGMQPTLVSGVSMEPTLRPGDVVITRDTPASEIVPGDIIRFRVGGSYILHRVIEVETSEGRPVFVTRGDANNTLDPAVLESQVEGKVVAVVPKVGWIGIAARSLMAWLR